MDDQQNDKQTISAGKVIPVYVEDEMQKCYIDYAMSVIVQRALPDVRDGLKPVHRRILYAMNEAGMLPNKAYKKAPVSWAMFWGNTIPTGILRSITPLCVWPRISPPGI